MRIVNIQELEQEIEELTEKIDVAYEDLGKLIEHRKVVLNLNSIVSGMSDGHDETMDEVWEELRVIRNRKKSLERKLEVELSRDLGKELEYEVARGLSGGN